MGYLSRSVMGYLAGGLHTGMSGAARGPRDIHGLPPRVLK